MCNDFYTIQTVCAIALHLNLALTGDCIFRFSKKKILDFFLSLLVYGDIRSVLINHLHVVISMLLYRFVSS